MRLINLLLLLGEGPHRVALTYEFMTYAALHKNKPEYAFRRRKLRREQTMAEKVLWRELRGRKFLGYKWRRQSSIGNAIADFCCFELRLTIELDGPAHEGQEMRDVYREMRLVDNGFKTIRYMNDEVLFDRERVLTDIARRCKERKIEIMKVQASNQTPLLLGEGARGEVVDSKNCYHFRNDFGKRPAV